MDDDNPFLLANLQAISKLEDKIRNIETVYTNEREWMRTGSFGIKKLNEFRNSERYDLIDRYFEKLTETTFKQLVSELAKYSKEFDYLGNYKDEFRSPRELIKSSERLLNGVQKQFEFFRETRDKQEISIYLSGKEIKTGDVMDAQAEILFQALSGKEFSPKLDKLAASQGSIYGKFRSLLSDVKENRETFSAHSSDKESPVENWMIWAAAATPLVLIGAYSLITGTSPIDVFSSIGTGIYDMYISIKDFVTSPEGVSSLVKGGVLGAGAAVLSDYLQNKRADKYPALYSDRERLGSLDEKKFDVTMIDYSAAVNDFCAAFSAAWNEARKARRNYNIFFDSLRDYNTTLQLKKYQEIVGKSGYELKARLEADDEFKKKYSSYSDLSNLAGEAGNLMDNSWSYSYTQDSHIESHTTTDEKGNSHTTYTTVIDRTHHYYTFNKRRAAKSIDTLEDAIKEGDDLYKTDIENAHIRAEQPNIARVNETIDKKAKQDKAETYLNQWNIAAGVPAMTQYISGLLETAKEWLGENDIKGFDTNYYGVTGGDSVRAWSPTEYDVCMDLVNTCYETDSQASAITDGINTALYGIKFLLDNVVDKSSDELLKDEKIKLADRAKEAIGLITTIYQSNFPDSKIEYDLGVSNSLTLIAGVLTGIATTAIAYNWPLILEMVK